MKRVIIVSGTPGTGKTKVAKQLARKYHAQHIDVNELVKRKRLYSRYDSSLCTYLVHADKVVEQLIKLIKDSKESLVIDSHLSHYLPRKYVDICYITKCDLPVLKKRLERRKYSKKKMRENLDAEILEVCLLEAARQRFKQLMVVDTTKKKPKLVRVR